MGRIVAALLTAGGLFWLLTKAAGASVLRYYGGLNQKSAKGPQAVPWLTPKGVHLTMQDGADSSWPVFGAISLKIMDGSQGPGSSNPWDDREISGVSTRDILTTAYEKADAAGCARFSWGFHYMQTVEQARKEGRAAAEAALRYKVTQYSCNCESAWISALPGVWTVTGMDKNSIERVARQRAIPADLVARGWVYVGESKVAAPVEHLRATANAFREAFKAIAPGVRLHICPVMPPSTMRAWDALDPETLSKWDGLDRMIFGNWRKWYVRKYEEPKEITEPARALNPSFAYIPMPAAGPVGSGYSGSVQGWVEIMQSDPWPAFGIFFGNYGHGWVEGVNGNIAWQDAMSILHDPGDMA